MQPLPLLLGIATCAATANLPKNKQRAFEHRHRQRSDGTAPVNHRNVCRNKKGMVPASPFFRNDGSEGDLPAVGLSIGNWTQPTPVQVEIVQANGSVEWLRVPYASLDCSSSSSSSTRTVATATSTSSLGSKLLVTDECVPYTHAYRVCLLLAALLQSVALMLDAAYVLGAQRHCLGVAKCTQ